MTKQATKLLWLVPVAFAATALAEEPPDPANEKKAEEIVVASVKEMNESCKANVNLVIDWPALRGTYKYQESESDEGGKQRKASYRCRQIVERLESMCRSEKAGPAIATIKTIKCTYESDRRAGSVTGQLANGVLTARFNWGMDMDSATAVLRSIVTLNGQSVAEAAETPKIDQRLEVQVEDINTTCKTTDITGAIDWKSFHGNYTGWASSGPSRVEMIWDGFRMGLIRTCRKGDPAERKKFFSRVKGLSVAYDGSLKAGELIYDIDGKGKVRLRINTAGVPSNIEEKFDAFVGVQTGRPPEPSTDEDRGGSGGGGGGTTKATKATKTTKPAKKHEGEQCVYSSECESRPGMRCSRPRGAPLKTKTTCMLEGY